MSYLLEFEVSVGDGPSRRIVTREASVTIGSGSRAVLQSHDRSLEDLHSVVLQRDDGTLAVLNYSRGLGTLLNGEPTESARMREGDELCCGETRVRLLERRATESGAGGARRPSALRDFVGWAIKRGLTRR